MLMQSKTSHLGIFLRKAQVRSCTFSAAVSRCQQCFCPVAYFLSFVHHSSHAFRCREFSFDSYAPDYQCLRNVHQRKDTDSSRSVAFEEVDVADRDTERHPAHTSPFFGEAFCGVLVQAVGVRANARERGYGD